MPTEALVYALLVGAVLAQLRQRSGRTQATFAGLVGITQPTLSRIERGQAHPTPHDVSQMAKLLGVSAAELTATIDAALVRLTRAIKAILGKDDCPWPQVLDVAGRRGIAALAAFAAAATIGSGGPHGP